LYNVSFGQLITTLYSLFRTKLRNYVRTALRVSSSIALTP